MRHQTLFLYVDAVARAGSIRGAAEALSITQSALNRRILAFEEELGAPIFERLPRGVRLSTAGELLIHHIRRQMSDMARVQSQIADLSGVRRGRVSVACSQALVPFFLPERIAAYRAAHPGVTFNVLVRDRAAAEEALMNYTADVAMVFEPVRMGDFATLATARQPVFAMMRPGHPLAGRPRLRLVDCLEFPLALPSAPYGVRALLERAAARLGVRLDPAVEADSFEFLRQFVARRGAGGGAGDDTIAFQIPIGLPRAEAPTADLATAEIDPRDVPPGRIHLAQLRGRVLPIAAARFTDAIVRTFAD
ncbi:MAG: LysR family transcriptional regulator [Pseudomonadota bacterium]